MSAFSIPSSDTEHFDFSTAIDRQHTFSNKWERYARQNAIPMWVADMDLASPPGVKAALKAAAERGIFGYGTITEALIDAFIQWAAEQYQWTIDPQWLVWIPGVVPGFNFAVEALTQPEDTLIHQSPVYPPIFNLARTRGRQTLDILLTEPAHNDSENTGWGLSIAELGAAVTPDAKALILCNPQNPTGRVYSRDELKQLGDIAERHDLTIISDEIWADLIIDPQTQHTPIASLSPELAARTITLMAPSKTFNIAGLSCSVAIIPDPERRRLFQQQLRGLTPDMNYLGLIAAHAAWTTGAPWLKALRQHLRQNFDQLEVWLNERPRIGYRRPEATFLAWLDVRAYGLENPAQTLLDAGVAVSDGRDFGAPGFIRVNLGCPEAQLQAALTAMAKVLD